MARMKDESKRAAILLSSKMLFSHKGFYNTSISDIVRETGLPVGTIYTYFRSKDDIVQDIVKEGWEEFYTRLERALRETPSPEERFRLLIDEFIPELLGDLDFINILLSEALSYTRIEEKIEKITDLVFGLLASLTTDSGALRGLARRDVEALLAIFFMGILSAVKLARTSSISMTTEDILGSVKKVIQSSLRIAL